jgi:hypothetical protein
MSNYKCIKKIGPYDGPFCYGLVSYFLKSDKETIVWHSGPNKIAYFTIDEIYTGIKTKKLFGKTVVDYDNSYPRLIQTKLL